MNITTSDHIGVNCADVANGHNAYVYIHDELGGFAMSIHMPNKQVYVIRSKGSTPDTHSPYHLLIVPGDKPGKWLHDWIDDHKEYYDVVGRLKDLIQVQAEAKSALGGDA